MPKNYKTPLTLLIILSLAAILYLPSLKYSFSQDDFIHLSQSQASSLFEVINFFNPLVHFTDIFHYRPLSTQFWFFINYSIFGYNPLVFRIESLLTHLLNSLLFYLIIKKLFKNSRLALLSTFFYSTSAIHFLSIYYISSFQQLLKSTFIFLSLYSYLVFIDHKKYLNLIYSLLFFLLSLLSKELSIIFPFILLPITYIYSSQKFEKLLKQTKYLIPFFIITFIYFVIRLLSSQTFLSKASGYSLAFSPISIAQNLKWYLIWLFGFPEIVSSAPSINPFLLPSFFTPLPYGTLFLTTALFFIVLIFTSLKKINLKLFSSLVILSSISLLPVLFLKNHSYPQYLDLALLGTAPLLSLILISSNPFKKLLLPFILATFFLVQFFSLSLSEQTHWTTHRSIVSTHYYKYLLKEHPALPKDSTLIFTGTKLQTKELEITLAKSYGPKIWYPQLKNVIYSSDPQITPPPSSITYPITVY